MTADVTVVGKVTEIEKSKVDARPHHGLSKDAKVAYTVAVIKVETALIGAKGQTQVRVGITDKPAGSTAVVAPLPNTRPPAKLEVGQEACFFLDQHPSADFYVLRMGEVMAPKSEKDFDDVLAEVRVVAKAITEPVAALKAKAPENRFLAAATILAHGPRLGTDGIKDAESEELPAEVNQLVLDVLLEMPWNRKSYTSGRRLAPNLTREGLWHYVDAGNYGYKLPRAGPTPRGVSPPDMSKQRDESTSTFLKANKERIRLKRMVRGK